MVEDMLDDMDSVDVLDLVNSLGTYKANEAGAFGNIGLTTEEIGAIGSAISDVQNVVVDFFSGDMTIEEAYESVKTTVAATVGVLVEKAMHIGAEVAAGVLKAHVPILAPVIDAAKDYIKLQIPSFAKKTMDTVKEYGKKAMNLLFG